MTKLKKEKATNLPVEIFAIVDASGSMGSIRNDAIGGFNTFIEDQKKIPDPANMTLITFNNDYNMVKYRVPLNEIEPLTEESYKPSGGTAMNDAIGRTISEMKRMKSEGKIDKAIVVILTDGEENASSIYNSSQIKSLIKESEELDWQILFLAANQDAFKTGASYGLAASGTANYSATSNGITSAFRGLGASSSQYRSNIKKGFSGETLRSHTTNLADFVNAAEDEVKLDS